MTNEVITADCFEHIRHVADQSIDCVITSPPYNIGVEYNQYRDRDINYMNRMRDLFIDIRRVLKPTGHFFLNVSPTRKDPLFAYRMSELVPMTIQNPIVWAKAVEMPGEGIRGRSVVSQNTDRYLCRGYEMVWHFTHTGHTPIDRERSSVPYRAEWVEDNFRRTGRRTRPTTDCWHIPYETTGYMGQDSQQLKGPKGHPAIFPRELVRHCIRVAGITKGTILDPFAGTGTVAVVCEEMGLDSISIEMDPDYTDFIKGRLAHDTRTED
jgi:site-specific DNA-methyltransferase (adenine-specific)